MSLKMTTSSVIFVLILALILTTVSPVCYGFNIDLSTHVEYRRPPETLFGFSVAAHQEANTGWVIVGAPEDDSEQAKVGIEKAGAVYRCQTQMPFRCDQIPFDTSGNNNASGTMIDDKSKQWFGATVHSSGKDGIIVACAPRYVYFSINKRRREPVGTCFTATDAFSKFSEYSPCRTAAWGYHRQGYCQAGFSAVVSDDRLYIGSVGSWYWQGQVFSQNLRNRLDLSSSREGPKTADNNYLGYSLAIGDFTGNGRADVAVGMPRSANLTGKVVLFTGQRLLHLHNLTGSQVGAYFGHSVAVLDVNGDGLDDIAIGAPLHSEPMERYEAGRVYVVYQNEDHLFRQWTILDGSTIGGRFGLSLAKLGDLDRDGFDDLAVGAPYDQQGGSVFIFRGGPNGIDEKPSQIIAGQDVDPRLQGFGYSLSGNVDLDGNGYPDFLVGAPFSGQSVYFRSRPVVRVTGKVELETTNGQIDPENRTCSLKSGSLVSCMTVKGCLKYEGDAVASELEFLVTFKLDTKKTMPRLFFLNEEGSSEQSETLHLKKNTTLCKWSYIYLLPNVRDKLSPLEVQMTYAISTTSNSGSGHQNQGSNASPSHLFQASSTANSNNNNNDFDEDLQPIIDPRQNSRALNDAASILKDCGLDNVCIPDLKIAHHMSLISPSGVISQESKYLIGSEDKLELAMNITNEGEDAYEATLYVALPKHVSYIKTEMIGSANPSELVSVLCSPPTLENNFVLKCELGNPMMGFSKISLSTIMKPIMHDGQALPIDLNVQVNSSNPELTTNLDDNEIDINIPVYIETDIVIRGLSDPDPLTYNSTAYESNLENIKHESEIGPELIHIYQVENKGPSDIEEAQVFILWPSFRPNGDPLLYLTSQPQIEGRARCEFVDDVNPYQVNVDRYHIRSASNYGFHPDFPEDNNDDNNPGIQQDYSKLPILPSSNTNIDENMMSRRPKRTIPIDSSNNQQQKIRVEMEWSSETRSQLTETSTRDQDLLDQLDCGPTKCTHMACTVGPLAKKESVVFRIYSRLWSNTISRLSHHQYEISSRLVSIVTKLPHNVDPSFLDIKTFTVTSKVISLGGDFLEGRSIPLWILLLAVLAGLIFLALVSLILWHFGFFRRRRRQQFEDINGIHNGSVIHANDANMYLHEASVTEKQPLAVATVTTNGYHHRQNRHSRQSLTYPHNMQPGDEVL